MKALKLTKDSRELYVLNNPTSAMFAIEYGWIFEVVTISDNTTLNTLAEIN
jgi:hypothetical protein